MVSSRSALVIGAGLAGLSAGYRLRQAGFDVKVLEKLQRVGGRVHTVRAGPYVIDSGPDAMTDGYATYKQLATDVGLGDQLVMSSPVVGLVRQGKVLDIDTSRIVSSLLTKGLSLKGKAQFAAGLWRIRKMFAGIDSSRLTDCAALDDEHENAEVFARRNFGREASDYIIDPLMRLVTGSGAAQASRLSILGGLVNWLVPLINIKGGLDSLPLTLAKSLDVSLGSEVEHVEEKGQRVEVAYRAEGRSQQVTSDVCVVASTFDVVERIYPSMAAHSSAFMRQLRMIKLMSISCAYSAPTRSKAYAIMMPTCESPDTLLLFLQHNKAPDRAPEGHSIVTIYTDTLATPHFLGQTDAAVTQWARSQVESLFPELAGHFALCSVSRWPVAGYLATPGFWQRTQALMQALPQDGRIQLAGDLFGAGSMESAVNWGNEAARRLIEYHGAKTT